jgi:hypothetical protein
MAFVSRVIGNLYVVRWKDATAADVPRVEAEVAAAKRALGKAPLHGLAIVPENTPAPDDRTRSAMSSSISHLLDHLETMHTVIEGGGFKHSILRSAMTGIVLVGGKRGRVVIHGTVSDALDALAIALGSTSAAIRAQFNQDGPILV